MFFTLLAVAAAATVARAETLSWEEVYPGVKYLRHEREVDGELVDFYAAKIDLSRPGLQFLVSPPRYIGKTTSSFARDYGAHVAVNGGFWTLVTHDPLGLVVTAGRRWPGSKDDRKYGFLAVTKEGKAWMSPPEKKQRPSAEEAYMAISGFPMIVREGKRGKVKGCGYICMTGPRTAVGLDRSGETLFMVVVDGRQEHSAGVDLFALSDFMIELGVWDGLNLDGGGSSTLYIGKKGGTVNDPCEGRERGVLNSVGVVLAQAESVGEQPGGAGAAGKAPAAGEAAARAALPGAVRRVEFTDGDFERGEGLEDPPRLRYLVKAAGVSAVLLFLVLGSALVLRKRRRKKGGG